MKINHYYLLLFLSKVNFLMSLLCCLISLFPVVQEMGFGYKFFLWHSLFFVGAYVYLKLLRNYIVAEDDSGVFKTEIEVDGHYIKGKIKLDDHTSIYGFYPSEVKFVEDIIFTPFALGGIISGLTEIKRKLDDLNKPQVNVRNGWLEGQRD